MTKTWTKEDITSMLRQSDKAVARGVIAIYRRQTEDEKAVGETKHDNGVGFNGADARYLSYCARWAMKTGKLTGRHLEKARKAMMKYAGQLAQIANERAQVAEVKSIEDRVNNEEMRVYMQEVQMERAEISGMSGSW